MTKSLEEFERETEKKRERLLRDLHIVRHLPTAGREVRWIGEGGYDGNTKLPDREKCIRIEPHIVHSPFRGAEHVVFELPKFYSKPCGEYQHSPHRRAFERAYLSALLDAFEPHIIETVAIKGTYASHVSERYDWAANKDYADAEERARGVFSLESDVSLGEYGSSRTKLEFFAHIEAIGVTRISIEVPHVHELAPRPVGVHHYSNGPVCRVDRWDVPSNNARTAECVNVLRYGLADRGLSYRLLWLVQHRESLDTILGLTADEVAT